MKRTKEEALQTREALLDAAVEVFYHRGVARSTMEQIARAAGVTRGALYWHFCNKEDLLDALCQHHFATVEAQLGPAEEAAQAEVTLQQLLESFTQFLEHMPHDQQAHHFMAILHLKCEETEDNRMVTDLLQRYRNLMNQRVRYAIEYSQRVGQLPAHVDARLGAILLQSCVLGIMSHWLMNPEAYDIAKKARSLLQACAFMLEHAPSLRNQTA